jgi:NADPH:quinone reductase-like Zn-dependent oxidoreductase
MDIARHPAPGGLFVTLPSGASRTLRDQVRRQGARAAGLLVSPDGVALRTLSTLVAAGALHIAIAMVLPLELAAAAHRIGESGRVRGKFVREVPAERALSGNLQ